MACIKTLIVPHLYANGAFGTNCQGYIICVCVAIRAVLSISVLLPLTPFLVWCAMWCLLADLEGMDIVRELAFVSADGVVWTAEG